jgi:hypothetical protein
MAYRVLTGLAYPTDSMIDEALREFGRQATTAAECAARTQDPRDIDAAATAEAERAEAVASAFESGALVERAPGDVVTDIPAKSLPWLLEQGLIVEVPSPSAIDEKVWQDLGRPNDADTHIDSSLGRPDDADHEE